MSDTVDWSRYRLAQMWEMVKNESTEVGLRQAQAWTDTAELCEDQANQLERAAAQLGETWVPAPGTAAEAFQIWLTNFTTSMRGSASTARTNGIAITDITYQMASAREAIAKLTTPDLVKIVTAKATPISRRSQVGHRRSPCLAGCHHRT